MFCDQLFGGTGREDTTLLGGKPAASDPLNRRERLAEAPEVVFNQCRQELHENQMGDPFHIVLRGDRQLLECLRFGVSAKSSLVRRHRDDTAPAGRDLKAGQQGCDLFAADLASPLYDESPMRKGPCSDGRPLPPVNGARQPERIHRQIVQLGDRAGNRKPELGS